MTVFDVTSRIDRGTVTTTAPDWTEALKMAHEASGKASEVTITDGWTTLNRWVDGTEREIRKESPGHPDGCACGECGVRAAHLEGAHLTDMCEHRTCMICGGCWECEQALEEAAHDDVIRDLIASADGAIVDALTATGRARGAIEDLMSNLIYDVELGETSEGSDAVAELLRAALSLRHAHRIIAARKRMEKG